MRAILSGMDWQSRITPPPTAVATDFVACVLREAGYVLPPRTERHIPILPARVKPTPDGITAFSGMPLTRFEALQQQLTEWLGSPKRSEHRIGPELLGANLVYPSGVTLNYMAERNDGISLYIPKEALKTLVSCTHAALDALSERKSQSPVAR